MPSLNLPSIVIYESGSTNVTAAQALMYSWPPHGSEYNMEGHKLGFQVMKLHALDPRNKSKAICFMWIHNLWVVNNSSHIW